MSRYAPIPSPATVPIPTSSSPLSPVDTSALVDDGEQRVASAIDRMKLAYCGEWRRVKTAYYSEVGRMKSLLAESAAASDRDRARIAELKEELTAYCGEVVHTKALLADATAASARDRAHIAALQEERDACRGEMARARSLLAEAARVLLAEAAAAHDQDRARIAVLEKEREACERKRTIELGSRDRKIRRLERSVDAMKESELEQQDSMNEYSLQASRELAECKRRETGLRARVDELLGERLGWEQNAQRAMRDARRARDEASSMLQSQVGAYGPPVASHLSVCDGAAPRTLQCCVCMICVPNRVFGCGHVMCSGCELQLVERKCPTCRAAVEAALPLFL